MYELQTYGIPTDALPMDEEGNLLLKNHLDWVEQQRTRESLWAYKLGTTMVPPTSIQVPRRFDVLLGRGKSSSEHTGNLRAFLIVEMNREKYERASKYEKTQIAEKIVHLIRQSYGRFLKRDTESGGLWVETSTEEARKKISHCFRRLRELDRNAKVSAPVKRKAWTS